MQLVELQEQFSEHPEIAVVAISYDLVPVLADFTVTHRIGYPLLSDVGSRVMGELGVLNPLIDDDLAYWGTEKKERHRGLPFPGVFVLDANGVIAKKHFERSHRNRASASRLMAGLGLPIGSAVVDEVARLGVAIRGSLPRAEVFPNQVFDVGVSLLVEPGRHLYVAPCPEGYQPLEVSVHGPDGVYWDPPALPVGTEMRLPALGETFRVVEDRIDIAIPTHIHESTESPVMLDVVLTFQVCDDTTCELPGGARLSLPVVVRPKM